MPDATPLDRCRTIRIRVAHLRRCAFLTLTSASGEQRKYGPILLPARTMEFEYDWWITPGSFIRIRPSGSKCPWRKVNHA